MVFLGAEFEAHEAAGTGEAALRTAVNDAIASNWEAIRAYTGATGDAVRLATNQHENFTVANAILDASRSDDPFASAADGKTMISCTFTESADIVGLRGVATDDPVLRITAKDAGTHMAGINIHFVNDTQGGLRQWNESYSAEYGANDTLPDIHVDFITNTDGSRALVVTGNFGSGAASEINAGLLAKALNANTEFQKHFTANATQFAPGAGNGAGVAGSVLFTDNITQPSAQTVGGYKVETDGSGTRTSSGIAMFGQADANERLVIESEELGSGSHVAINIVSGFLNTVDASGFSSGYATGSDMMATINGLRATTSGNNISLNSSDLAMSATVANGVGNHGFTITGGGALFQLGPEVVSQQQMRIGIGSMLTTNLGGASGTLFQLRSGQAASLESDDNGRRLADRIVSEAISNVATVRGRLGAIQKGSLEPNVMALQDSMTALTEANAMISNADFAVESSNMTRLQLLIQAGAQTLGIANQMPQYAAMLVR